MWWTVGKWGSHPSRCLILGKRQVELWKSRGVMELFSPRKRYACQSLLWLAGLGECHLPPLPYRSFSSWLVSPALSQSRFVPSLSFLTAVFHLCLLLLPLPSAVAQAVPWVTVKNWEEPPALFCTTASPHIHIPGTYVSKLNVGKRSSVRMPTSGAMWKPALMVRASLDCPGMVVHTHSSKI